MASKTNWDGWLPTNSHTKGSGPDPRSESADLRAGRRLSRTPRRTPAHWQTGTDPKGPEDRAPARQNSPASRERLSPGALLGQKPRGWKGPRSPVPEHLPGRAGLCVRAQLTRRGRQLLAGNGFTVSGVETTGHRLESKLGLKNHSLSGLLRRSLRKVKDWGGNTVHVTSGFVLCRARLFAQIFEGQTRVHIVNREH